MTNNRMLTWIIGIGAAVLAIVGWMLPRRKTTPAQRTMRYVRQAAGWVMDMRRPVMRMGMRAVKGMIR